MRLRGPPRFPRRGATIYFQPLTFVRSSEPARDSSGTLESLHAEFVCDVYRRAVTSDYKGRGLGSGPDLQRNALMNKRYKSTHVLSRYRPHFPLLRNLPSESKQSVCQQLQAMLQERVPSSRIRVDRLAVISRNGTEDGWHVVDEMPLS
jgi:hypothetical protein